MIESGCDGNKSAVIGWSVRELRGEGSHHCLER